MSSKPQANTLAGLTLAFEMMGRAYEALALLNEMHRPGEYADHGRKIKEYIADNFRHVEAALTEDAAGVSSFREAVLIVREVFDRVDAEVLATQSAFQRTQR